MKHSGKSSRRGGDQPLQNFEANLGLPDGFTDRPGGDDDEFLAQAIPWMTTSRPPRQNFWPALTLSFIAQCEQTLELSGQMSDGDPFTNFPIEEGTGGKVRNTLNFMVGETKSTLRPYFNRAAEVIRVSMRRDHPSAAAHATQAWTDYRDLVVMIFQMSPAARTRFAEWIWQEGVLDVPERRWATQAERIVRPFEKTLSDFETRGFKPGGALFQGLVFGFFSADSPNLTLESHKVNTGSSRADMPGDVAGFRGGEVELAVEVKDFAITETNVEAVLVDFLEDLVDAPNATAVVVADSVDQPSRQLLAGSNVIALSRDDLKQRVITWDLPKQQEALRGAVYYLGRIQKNTTLENKLIDFLYSNNIGSGIVDQPIIKDATAPVKN